MSKYELQNHRGTNLEPDFNLGAGFHQTGGRLEKWQNGSHQAAINTPE